MTNAFRRIHKEHEKTKIDALQMIPTLMNTLLNLQQMSCQQVEHIELSLPLNCNSREHIFLNTYLIDKHTFIIKPSFSLKQDPNNSEEVMFHSIIDYYIMHAHAIKHSFFQNSYPSTINKYIYFKKEKKM